MWKPAGILMLGLVPVLVLATGMEQGQKETRPIPELLDTRNVSFEIVDMTFVTEYAGVANVYNCAEPDKLRGAVVTLRVKKTADKPLTLLAPDLSLHYYFGEKSDTVPCRGISGFSKDKDTDRPMQFFAGSYGRSTTGLATTKATVVYVDVFFDHLESDTSDVHLLVAQPVGASYSSSGWSAK
ncbi:MAG: hypothetical protein ABIG44_01275 [Planctomycetota bacterium]